jgi:cytoplasmic tRNA 2-thiolation protein 1
MYAHFKRLDYFSTECLYSPHAYRGFAREFLKSLERSNPATILDIIRSGERCVVNTSSCVMPTQGTCQRCGYISSQALCKACVLLDDLHNRREKRKVVIEYES